MSEKVFKITGQSVANFIIDGNSIKMMNKSFDSFEAFNEEWAKKLSLAHKTEIKLDKIKIIKKENDSNDVIISYKYLGFFPMEAEFSFDIPGEFDEFCQYFVKVLFFKFENGQLSPFKAIKNYLIGLLMATVAGVFCYIQAVEIASGKEVGTGSGKSKLFNTIIGALGEMGVLAISLAGISFILYKIWTRYQKPPIQTSLTPPYR